MFQAHVEYEFQSLHGLSLSMMLPRSYVEFSHWNIHVYIAMQKHAQEELIHTLTSMPRLSSPACNRPIAILPLCSSYSVLDTLIIVSN